MTDQLSKCDNQEERTPATEPQVMPADELSEDELNNVAGGKPSAAPVKGGDTPTESVSFNYGAVQVVYKQQ